MAASTTVLVAKAVLIIATDKRTWATAASMVAAALAPSILIIMVILSALSGTSSHNDIAVDLTFRGGYSSSKLPADYRMYIEKMRESFVDLDTALTDINAVSGDGEVDVYQVKVIFYSLFFDADQPRMDSGNYRSFADCFVIYEERLDGEEEPYMVAVPITNLETVYGNLAILLGKPVTAENKGNARRICVLAKYRQISPGSGLPPGEALGDGSYAASTAEAEEYLGYPCVRSSSAPQTSFNCSGFMCWVYTQSSIYNLPRTSASGIYNQRIIVPGDETQPGDLVFFTRTYASSGPVSYVGIYVGGGRMLHCGSPIQYTNIETNYWREHSYAIDCLSS